VSNSLSVFISIASKKDALGTAIRMALLVGLILNFINQGEALLKLDTSALNFPKFLLTFLVPFSVSLYSSTATKMKFFTGEYAFVNAELICRGCRTQRQTVRKGNQIETCRKCKKPTKWKLTSLQISKSNHPL
jgi:hypothetical protein